MIIDVTVPVQALVNDSKLFIPGGRAKVRLYTFARHCTDFGLVQHPRVLGTCKYSP